MKQDRLVELIRDVDELMPRRGAARVNVQEIRQRAVHKRRVRSISSIAAAMIGAALVGFGLFSWPDRSLNPQVAGSDVLKRLHVQSDLLLAQLDTSDEIQGKINARAQHHKRVDRLHRQIAAIPDPRIAVRKEVSQAARTLVASADRLLQEPGQKRQARKTYERVVRLFPENNWANIARKRLLAMKIRTKAMKGDLP